MDKKTVTIKDIAAAAGVYPATVSAVLGNRRYMRISQERRDRIFQLAKELGYHPNRQASCLRRGKSPAIGVFLPSWSSNLLFELASGLSEGCQELGYPIAFKSGVALEHYQEFLQQMTSKRNTAIVTYEPIWESHFEELNQMLSDYVSSGGHVVVIHYKGRFSMEYVSVGMDESYGSTLAANYLLEAGCHSLLEISSDFMHIHRERSKAFTQAAGKFPVENLALPFEKHQWQVHDLLVEKLGRMRRPCGIFCAGEMFRHEVAVTLLQLGWRIGQDCHIVSYDCDSNSEDFVPMAHIVQPYYEMGRLIAQKLEGLLLGQEVASERLKPTLTPESLPDKWHLQSFL